MLQLKRIDFDVLENAISAAIRITDIGMFIDDDLRTAQENVSMWFRELPPQQMYLGWDDGVYPRYELTPEKNLNRVY